jgi:hypothetical protein
LLPVTGAAQIAADSLFLSSANMDSATTTSQDSGKAKSKSPRGAMLRSLIIPGWGQFYNGKWFKGILVGGAELGLITNAVILNQYAARSTTLMEREFYQNNRNLSFWWLGAVILYSIGDAFVDAHLYKFDEAPNLTVKLQPQEDRVLGKTFLVSALAIELRW